MDEMTYDYSLSIRCPYCSWDVSLESKSFRNLVRTQATEQGRAEMIGQDVACLGQNAWMILEEHIEECHGGKGLP